VSQALLLPDADLERVIRAWLPAQRWYAGKHSAPAKVEVHRRITLVSRADLCAEHVEVEVTDDSGERGRYQVPLGYRARLPDGMGDAALLGSDAQPVVYDGLRDPELAGLYLSGIAAQRRIGSIRFHRNATYIAEAQGRLLSGEQSNTSVVFGDEHGAPPGQAVLVKFFRRLQPGINPDVEIGSALTAVHCPNVPALAGWVETQADWGVTTLAMATQFEQNASDGWTMALTSVRDLFAEADLHADEVGGDFAGEAERLGAAVAAVHTALAETLGVAEISVAADVLPQLRADLDVAIAVVPELSPRRDAVLAVYAEAAELGSVAAHRVHGDLHLGQVLRSPHRWLVIDFEGEPLRPLEQRRRPDSPLRDIAGMLRSFDYAGHLCVGDPSVPGAAQRRIRAVEWVDRNVAAFLTGYIDAGGPDPAEQAPLLRAYQLAKAVYEASYEARNRPDWLHLPLRAISELAQPLRSG
jgi:maltokinase